mgnify:CR=1 FL=1
MKCNIFRIRPTFYLKRGIFGEYGWIRVNFWKWLWMQNEHVNRIKWIKRK